MKLRLDRWLAMLGLGSRSQVKEWIRAGQIAAEGRVIRDPSACFESESCALTAFGNPVDGRVIRHVMLYKPAGLLTAARDAKQPTVMDLLPAVYRGIGCMPVGRLDKDTTGLLLLTCDGEMNHRLLSPARHVEKRYRAETEGCLGPGDAERFAAGLDLGDFTARPARLEILSASESGSAAEVTVTEGKFHQVMLIMVMIMVMVVMIMEMMMVVKMMVKTMVLMVVMVVMLIMVMIMVMVVKVKMMLIVVMLIVMTVVIMVMMMVMMVVMIRVMMMVIMMVIMVVMIPLMYTEYLTPLSAILV